MSWIVQTFSAYQGLIGLVLVGLSVALTVFDRVAKQRNKELIETQGRLIDTMKTEREDDLRRIGELEDKQSAHHDEILKFQGANELLKALLTEKDEASVGYRTKALESFAKTDQMHTLTQGMVELLERLCLSLEGKKQPARKKAHGR